MNLHLYLYLHLHLHLQRCAKDYTAWQVSILSWRTTIGGHQPTSRDAPGNDDDGDGDDSGDDDGGHSGNDDDDNEDRAQLIWTLNKSDLVKVVKYIYV